MKLEIENFRTIAKSTYIIKEGEINYLLGANESGKTNLLNSIMFMDFNSGIPNESDHTLYNKIKISGAVVYIEKNGKRNFINETSWSFFSEDSKAKKTYLKETSKLNREDISNAIDQLVSEGKFSQNKENYMAIVDKLKGGKFITEEEFDVLLSEESDGGIFQVFSNIKKLFNELKIILPNIKYISPILEANKDELNRTKYKELKDKDSLIRRIFDAFLSDEDQRLLENLEDVEGNIEESESDILRDDLFLKVNKELKKYFSSIKNIVGYPRFIYQGGFINLSIDNKNNWEIDSFKENNRSTGFKAFFRILLNIKADIAKNNYTYFLIDEPEQALHPFLQEELTKILETIINKKNITILFSTHSPYIIKEKVDLSNVTFVMRNYGENTKLPTGSTYNYNLLENNNFYKLFIKYMNNELAGEEKYSFKIFLDRTLMVGSIEQMNKDYKKLNNCINENEKIQELKKTWYLKNFRIK